MSIQHINNTPANSGLGDTLKIAFDKVNENFQFILDNYTDDVELTSIIDNIQTQINDLETSLSSYSLVGHTHIISNIIGLQNALNQLVPYTQYITDINLINQALIIINQTIMTLVEEAPENGNTYARKDGSWIEITSSSNLKPISEIKDLFIATSNRSDIEDNFLTYLSTDGTYKQLIIGTYVPEVIFRTNEITRIGNDLFVVGRIDDTGTGDLYQYFILALYGCYFENDELKVTATNIEFIDTGIGADTFYIDIHGIIVKDGFLYLETRPKTADTIRTRIFKINPYDLTDIKSIEIPLAGQGGYVNYSKNNLFTVITTPTGDGWVVKVADDLSSYEQFIEVGLTADRRVVQSTSFGVYQNKLYIPSIYNVVSNPLRYNSTGWTVYDCDSGEIIQQELAIPISTGQTQNPTAHWMTIFNDKLICSYRTSQQALVRFDLNTLDFEEYLSLTAYSPITDDNTIFSNGEMYLNGEGSNTASLLKVKYNDFTTLTTELTPYRSAGSIDVNYNIFNDVVGEAPEDGLEYIRKDGKWTVKSDSTAPLTMLSTYDGVRLAPVDPTIAGFHVNRSANIRTGYSTINSSTGNGAVTGYLMGASEDYSAGSMSMQFFGNNYYIPHLRNRGAVYTPNELFNITINNSNFTWRTGVGFTTTEEVFKIKSKVLQLFPTTQPASPTTGDFLLNSAVNNRPNIYDGSVWRELAYLSDISGGGSWGSITGTLSDQTDLQTALNAKQNNFIVVSSNQTAVNDEQYSNVANATYTDPTPVEGKGYNVKVVNGTATIGGVGYAEGRIVTRTYHSGSWRSRVYVDETIVGSATQTALGLKTDKINSNILILSKANSSGVGISSNSTSETVLYSFLISGGTFSVGDFFKFKIGAEKDGTVSNVTYRVRVGVNGDTSDNLLASCTIGANNSRYTAFERQNIYFDSSSTLRAFAPASTTTTDITSGNPASNVSCNPSNNFYISITAQLTSTDFSCKMTTLELSRTKTF